MDPTEIDKRAYMQLYLIDFECGERKSDQEQPAAHDIRRSTILSFKFFISL